MRRLRRIIGIIGITAAVVAGATLLRRTGQPGDPAGVPAFDPAFDLPGALELAAVPRASRFVAPMGSEHGAMTYNAQPFLLNRHLGDDLNGIGGQNSDLGDPVYAAGNGRVLYAGDAKNDWGNVVILGHRLDDGRLVQSFYGHLDSITVGVGGDVARGEEIGKVGNVGGRYLAHLHFEIRESTVVAPAQGYWPTPLDRVSPQQFLDARWGEGIEPWRLNGPPKPDEQEGEGLEMRFDDGG